MKWKIYFLLFGSFLSLGIFTTFTKTAHAIESYKISPAQDREFKRNYYQSMYLDQSKNINMHYYFYASDKYSRNIKLISFICENQYDNYKELPDCGLYMVQEAGSFKIKLKATGYTLSDYDREKQESTYAYVNHSYDNTQFVEVASYTDGDFKKGLTLLGGTTLKTNTWNLNEGGFLLDPVGGSSGNSNNSQNNNGGGFDILGGIKSFFQNMITAILRLPDLIINLPRIIIDGIKDIFNSLSDIIRGLFVPADNDLNQELGNLRSMFSFEQITRVLNTTYLPLDSVGFRYDSNCVANYWDATSPHLANLYNSGSNKYWDGYARGISICNVPKIYITLARNLLLFAFFWWAVYRILQIIPVVMGSAYVWDRWTKKEG